MHLGKFMALGALATLLLCLPAFADTWKVFPVPTSGVYIPSTTNYGGGDGSLNTISSLGAFNFSTPLTELSVPASWPTWNCPPATESCTPNVLWTDGVTTIRLTLTANANTAGIEVEPHIMQAEFVSVIFRSSTGSSFLITRSANGSSGALLFAAQDDTPGAHIVAVDIVDNASDDFAIAQLRQGNSVPEPSTMILLGSGLLSAVALVRRKLDL